MEYITVIKSSGINKDGKLVKMCDFLKIRNDTYNHLMLSNCDCEFMGETKTPTVDALITWIKNILKTDLRNGMRYNWQLKPHMEAKEKILPWLKKQDKTLEVHV